MALCKLYAEGFNILHEANAGSQYVKEGDAEVAPMADPESYCYDIDVAEVKRAFGVVVALLVLGYSILPLLYYAAIESLAVSMGEYQTLVKGVGLFTLLWILAFPLLSLALHYLRGSTLED